MELEWKTCTLGLTETVQETVVENPFDLDLQLPEWAPDIHRCLRCIVTPQIRSVNVSSDRVQAEGVGVLRLLYCSENGKPAVIEQTFPIRRFIPLPEDLPQPQVHVRAVTEYVNCRASGQRKAAVHGVISIRFTVLRRRETAVPTGCAQPQVQTRGRTLNALSATAQTERVFAMSEVVELGEQDAPIAGIVESSAYVQVESTKAVQDKLLVKGEVVTQVVYLPADDPDTFAVFRHTMPLSQVIETPGVSENDLQDVSLLVLAAEVTPKSDGSGGNRLLDVALQIEASVRCFAQTELRVIEDAYATTEDLRGTYTDAQWRCNAERWQEPFRASAHVDMAGTEMRAVQLCVHDIVRQSVQAHDGKLEVQCAVGIGLLGSDGEDALVWAEKTLDFSCVRNMPGAADDSVICAPTVLITQCRASIGADGAAEIQAEGFIDGTVYTLERVRMLTDAVCTPPQDGQTPAALTIYFADEGEPLWDVARAYRTTVEAIRAENGLTQDVLGEKQMLVIPTAAIA